MLHMLSGLCGEIGALRHELVILQLGGGSPRFTPKQVWHRFFAPFLGERRRDSVGKKQVAIAWPLNHWKLKTLMRGLRILFQRQMELDGASRCFCYWRSFFLQLPQCCSPPSHSSSSSSSNNNNNSNNNNSCETDRRVRWALGALLGIVTELYNMSQWVTADKPQANHHLHKQLLKNKKILRYSTPPDYSNGNFTWSHPISLDLTRSHLTCTSQSSHEDELQKATVRFRPNHAKNGQTLPKHCEVFDNPVPRWCCDEFHNLLWGSWACIQAPVLKPCSCFWAQHWSQKAKKKVWSESYTWDGVFSQSLTLWEAAHSECHCNALTIRYNPFSDAMCSLAGLSHFAKASQWLKLKFVLSNLVNRMTGGGLEGVGVDGRHDSFEIN